MVQDIIQATVVWQAFEERANGLFGGHVRRVSDSYLVYGRLVVQAILEPGGFFDRETLVRSLGYAGVADTPTPATGATSTNAS